MGVGNVNYMSNCLRRTPVVADAPRRVVEYAAVEQNIAYRPTSFSIHKMCIELPAPNFKTGVNLLRRTNICATLFKVSNF